MHLSVQAMSMWYFSTYRSLQTLFIYHSFSFATPTAPCTVNDISDNFQSKDVIVYELDNICFYWNTVKIFISHFQRYFINNTSSSSLWPLKSLYKFPITIIPIGTIIPDLVLLYWRLQTPWYTANRYGTNILFLVSDISLH